MIEIGNSNSDAKAISFIRWAAVDFHQFAFVWEESTNCENPGLPLWVPCLTSRKIIWLRIFKNNLFLQFSDKDKVSIFDGNDGHWINLSDIQSGRKLAEIVTLLTLTLNWHPANIHLHFMKNWTKVKKENSFKYWNKKCLLLLSYKRYPRLLIRVFLFWLYPKWMESICHIYCPSQ